MAKILITIPAYNEQRTLGKVIDTIHAEMKKSKHAYEIQVVDDGSKDSTAQVAKNHKARVISHQTNLGLAQTFQTELKHALKRNPDVIVHTDADGQYRAQDILKIVQPVLDKKADLVLGSRFQGTIESMPWLKRFGNRAFSHVIAKITKLPISDAQTGFRAFTPEVASSINIISDFTYTQEQIIKAARQRFRIIQVPIYFAIRGGKTKSRLMKNPIDFALKAGINLLRIYRDYRPLYFFGLIGLSLVSAGLLVGLWILYNIATTGITGGLPRVVLSAVFILSGVQVLLFGFLADMKK